MITLIACTVWISGICAASNSIQDIRIPGNGTTCPDGYRLRATVDAHSGAIEIWCAPTGKEVKP
jgi:hypothetical protein